MRIEAARVREHPEPGIADGLRLPAEHGMRPIECDAVGADADYGDDPRPIAPDFAFERPPAGSQFVVVELGGACGGAGDEVGDPAAACQQLELIRRREPPRREAGGMERRPESVAGTGEMLPLRGRHQARVDADKEDVEIRTDDIG